MMTSLLLARVFLPAITKIRAPKISRVRSLSMTHLERHIQKCIRESVRTTELPIQTATVRVPKRDDHVGPCHAFGLFTIHSVDNVTVDQTCCVDLLESTTSFHQQDISDGSRSFLYSHTISLIHGQLKLVSEAVSHVCAVKFDPLDAPNGSGIASSTICNPELLTFDKSGRNSGLIISMASNKHAILNGTLRDIAIPTCSV